MSGVQRSPHPRIWDGKQSVEHQIGIHVDDLVQFSSNSSEVRDILRGLQYVLEYRIHSHPDCGTRGGVSLEREICDRLNRSLLLFTGERKTPRGIFGQDSRPSENANLAFLLLAEFSQTVNDCWDSLRRMESGELKHRLRFYHRIMKSNDGNIREEALILLRMFERDGLLPWADYVDDGEIDEISEVLATCNAKDVAEGAKEHKLLFLFPPPSLYFDRDPRRVLDMFGTTLEWGLTLTMVAERRQHYGENRLPSPHNEPIRKMLLRQFADLMIILLIITCLVSLWVDWPRTESAIILAIVVVVNVAVGFWQEVRSARTVAAMKSLHVPLARVHRHEEAHLTNDSVSSIDGISIAASMAPLQIIPATELAPGDIVELREGDVVPADLRLLRVNRLEVDESMLTGESHPVTKGIKAIRVPSRRLPISRCSGNAFMGTMVLRGSALGVVVRIGIQTEIGRISAALSGGETFEKVETTISNVNSALSSSPLKHRLSILGRIIVLVAVLLCAAVVLSGFLRGGYSSVELTRLAISLAVSVIPEGLVAILTVAISLAIHRLATRKALARRLNVVEKLGAISMIASDKTGTITEGRMRMLGFWFVSSNEEGSPLLAKDLVSIVLSPLASSRSMEALNTIVLCNNATLEGNGDPTEAALLQGALAMGLDVTNDKLNHHRLLEIPFDSERRMMSVVVRDVDLTTEIVKTKNINRLSPSPPSSITLSSPATNSPPSTPTPGVHVYSKGAVEVILPLCQDYFLGEEENSRVPINESVLSQVAQAMDVFADMGLRVMGLAYRRDISLNVVNEAIHASESNSPDFSRLAEKIERDMTFVGLVGLTDPPRAGVAHSVALCKAAGIRVCMVTGDHLRTAMAIARQVGIYGTAPDDRVLHGRDLDILDVYSLANLQPFPSVFARVSPGNKLMIVKALQLRQEIVAMTGDGVNDAPAIKQADVGVAMGGTGTEITRDAADLILLTDDFSVLVEAIVQGRQMFRNVTLFIVYLLSCNSAEIWTVLGAIILGWPSPLTPLAILWANIIADIPPSMSLALEAIPSENLMRVHPAEVAQRVLAAPTWILVLVNGFLLAIITLSLYGYNYNKDMPLPERRSEAFLILVGLQIILALFSRSTTQSILRIGIWSNLWLIGAVILSLGLLVAGLYVPWLARQFELQSVSAAAWLHFGIGLLILLVGNEFTKFLLRRQAASRQSQL